MDRLVEKLEALSLDKFIGQHQHELCSKTVNQNKVAAFLKFDFDLGAIINDPPDNFSKCQKLYELIQKKSKGKDFLEAMKETGNEHIIEIIESVVLAPQGSNSKMGIWFNIPEPIESFYGREDFLTQLHDKLKPRDDFETEVTVLSQVKIVSGLGGIGKTETARRYIMKHPKKYNNFIWIDAQSENSMKNSFLNLAIDIKIPVKNEEGKSREIEEIVKEIYNKICEGGKSNLIIFDNAEDYQSCKNFFPISLHPHIKRPVILATSRNQEWTSRTGKITVLPLDVLTDDESLEFILKELEIEDSPEFREQSKEFIQLIGGLPLALQQAVAYIRNEKQLKGLAGTPYKISDYVLEFKSSMEKFLSFSPIPESESATVFFTWNVTFAKIQKLENGEEAVKILEILSFLYADKIPLPFLRELVPEIPERKFSAALKLLKKYSLIKANLLDFCLSIHRQLQFVILQYLEKCNAVPNVATQLIEKCTVVLDKAQLSKSSDIFLNIHQIVNNPFNLIQVDAKFLDFQFQFGLLLCKASRYNESLDLCKKVYSGRRELLSDHHEKTISAQSQIAVDLFYLGRYDESLAVNKETLKNKTTYLGPDDPSTITTKQNTAIVLQRQTKYSEALELFQQVVAQWEKIYGANHPSALATQNQMALIHSRLGNFPQALALYEDAERKQEQLAIRGPNQNQNQNQEHVLIEKHSKACVLYKMGRFQQASAIFHEVYEKRKELLGENHMDTINILGWIGVNLEEQGKSAEASSIHKTVYEKRKGALGENHENTLGAQNVIALNLLNLGKYEDSLTLFKSILKRTEIHLDVDHPLKINTQNNIAIVLREQGKYQESLQLLQQVLAQGTRVFGENHPSTLNFQVSIASLHTQLGDFSQALALHEHVERKRGGGGVGHLDPDHVHVLIAKHEKACLFFKMGRVQEASVLFNRVYEKRKQILGESHVHTAKTLYWIARILEQQGNSMQALQLYNKVYDLRKTSFGEDHPKTIEVKSNIDDVETKLQD